MLTNTFWFIQTSKKGYLYDCSCESCPCSFSFFSSITNPVRIHSKQMLKSQSYLRIRSYNEKLDARAEIAPIFFIYPPKWSQEPRILQSARTFVLCAWQMVLKRFKKNCVLRDSYFPINPYQITRLQCKLPSIFYIVRKNKVTQVKAQYLNSINLAVPLKKVIYKTKNRDFNRKFPCFYCAFLLRVCIKVADLEARHLIPPLANDNTCFASWIDVAPIRIRYRVTGALI
jgi:hypothetical protein